jgi:prokaryotic YEATS domain
MEKGKAILIGVVVLAVIAVFTSPLWIEKPPPTPESRPACLAGLPSRVQEECACGAAQREVQVALEQTQLNALAQSNVMTCLNSDLSIDFMDKSIVSGKGDSCLRRVQELDPTIRDQAVAIVASAVSRSSSESVLSDQKIWHDCYARLMAPPAPRETLASKNAKAGIEIRSTATPLPSTQADAGRLFEWHIWVADIDEMLPDLKEIYYSFDHPSFDGHISQSATASNSFQIRYRGWGCVRKVTATLVFKDDSRLAKPLDQCSVMPTDTPTKGGGVGSFTGGPGFGSNQPMPIPRKCAPGEAAAPLSVQSAPPCVP